MTMLILQSSVLALGKGTELRVLELADEVAFGVAASDAEEDEMAATTSF